MEVKLIEVRDAATFIPALAIRLGSEIEAERYLFGRAGFGTSPIGQGTYIILIRLEDSEAHYDPQDWRGLARTMPEAHRELLSHWADYQSGDVLDVQFVLGEKAEKKVSERLG